MAKGKSSASSATRKKHARKAGGGGAPDEPAIPKEKKAKGKEKKSKEPRKKVYIPPVKPAPVQPDPLDTLGLAQRLPPELLVVLRRFAKKDSTTKRRALEELQSGWVDKARNNEWLLYDLEATVPVWLHHAPALFLHPSRRIRLLAVGLHSSLLRLSPSLRDQLFLHIREVASDDQAEYIIGTWCAAAYDVDRQVSLAARDSWNNFVSPSGDSGGKLDLGPGLVSRLWDFLQRTLLDPGGVYSYLNPLQAVCVPSAPQRGAGRGTATPRKDFPRAEEISSPARPEDEEEGETDRRARLRVGAFGALEWMLNTIVTRRSNAVGDEFLALFGNLALWSSLYHAQMPPFVPLDAFGCDQPMVRRSAWQLLQTLLRTCKSQLSPFLPILSSAVLRSAWVEPDSIVRGTMWQPLLMFLREFPQAWTLEASFQPESNEADDSDGEESEDEAAARETTVDTRNTPSQAYREFLQFLELGCAGSPLQGYPTVLVILSTIPASIFATSSAIPPLDELFTSFWAAIDGRALSSLDRIAASVAFLSALLECLVFLVRRLLKSPLEQASLLVQMEFGAGDSGARTEAAQKLICDQIATTWKELASQRLKVEGIAAGELIARTLTSLYQLDADLFRSAWDTMASSIKEPFSAPDTAVSPLVPVVLKTFQGRFEAGSEAQIATKTLITEVVQATVQQCEVCLASEEVPDSARVASLVSVLNTFGELLFSDHVLAKRIDDSFRHHMQRLLSVMPSLLFVYLSHRRDETLLQQTWHDVLSTIASHPEDASSLIVPLVDAAEKCLLPDYLVPQAEELDNLSGILLAEALAGPFGSNQLTLIRRLLRTPDHFVSQSCFQGLVHSLSSSFTLHFQNVLHDASLSLDAFEVPLNLIHTLTTRKLPSLLEGLSLSVMPDVFLFAYLLPMLQPVPPQQDSIAKQTWELWRAHVPEDTSKNTLALTVQRLRELFADCTARPTPETILAMVAAPNPGFPIDVMSDILPTSDTLHSILAQLPSNPADPSLAVVDPLIPPASLYHSQRALSLSFDRTGFSEYPRLVNGLLLYFAEDRHEAKANLWALHHFLVLRLYADELLDVPSSHSGIFANTTAKAVLHAIRSRVEQVVSYLMSFAQEEGWHTAVVKAILADQAAVQLDNIGRLLFDLISQAKREDTVRESRVVYIILQHTLDNATKAEADQWITIARKLEKQAPQMSLAVLSAITRFGPETPLLDRYRNELAAGLLGIRPSLANTDGLWLLRRLVASAPDPDSDIVFLPQLRAVNVMKAFQQWITSDEDLDVEVESEMTAVFMHLAPILQNIPGTHWDLVFDVMENNLENSSFSESSTLVTLSRTLRLIIAIQDLTSTNKSLRAAWERRQSACLTLVRDLITAKLDSSEASSPLSVTRELALQVVQDLPRSLLDETTLSKLCHVVTDSSLEVQKMSYRLLHEAARKYTEHLVIEAAVESEATDTPQLPLELVDILQRNLYYEDVEADGQDMTGYLLAWMITFDLFANASLKVKSMYIDHLRGLDLVSEHLLPNLFSILGLYGGTAKAFKLDIWGIDDFDIELYSPEELLSLRLLAAHLYYRALLSVPMLVRNYMDGCRDRQLSITVTAYTSRYVSPAIVQAAFAQVKNPEAIADLVDESLTIKVAPNANEVTASYAVDDYQLELTVKYPADYPLRRIEIRETKWVSVKEERWRSWILGLQQILNLRSGSIVDGLTFFKKNVSSHFQGLAECAICYSLLSATDGALPRKPCKTCKNLFHAGCLFKWFSTSHSSSCPLCRSEII